MTAITLNLRPLINLTDDQLYQLCQANRDVRQNQRVEIYRQGQQVEVLQSPATLSGEDVLLGFVLDLSQIL